MLIRGSIVTRERGFTQEALWVWQSSCVSTPFDSVTQWLTIPDIAQQLNISIGKVHRLVEEHQIFTVRIEGVQKVPAELFVDGEPLPSIRGTILVLIDSGFSPDSAAQWLYTVEESIGRRPIESLLDGRKSEVRRIAQSLAL